MSALLRSLPRLLALGALALPAVAGAQRQMPPRPMPDGPPRTGVSRLIDARRELDLTARQLVQLDSIERAQVTERRQMQERMAQRRDSMVRQRETLRGADRDSLRAIARQRMEEMRPQLEQARRRDSVTMAAAERILTEPQRQRLREMRAEERGRQRGLREARVQGMRGGVRGGSIRQLRRPDGSIEERRMIERGAPPRGERPMRRPPEIID